LRVPQLGVRKTLDPSAPSYDVYLPQGEHTLEVRGLDHAGNETVEEIHVRVATTEGETTGGAEPTGGDEDDDDGESETDAPDAAGDRVNAGCACTTRGVSGGPGALLWLVLTGAFVRPARRSKTPRPRAR
ncbi:MAG: hypothetical protein KUG77_29090, partial [Nannocystaceae bacterium]|nr:hypothetical protein [Nannocystaceae bacterium]